MGDIWYRDISSLWKKPFDFFPVRQPGSTDAEYVNTLVRFTLYTALVLFIYTRRPVVFGYAGVVITILSVLYHHRTWKMARQRDLYPREFCRLPTRDNPYANTLSHEYGEGEWTPCDGVEDQKQRMASLSTVVDLDDYPNSEVNERQFITLPNGGYGPDFASFSKELAKGSGIMD